MGSPRAGPTAVGQRIALCREAGGLGDVLRAMACARKLTAAGHRVTAFALAGFDYYASRVAGVSAVVPVADADRRGRDKKPDPDRFEYLRRGGPYDQYVDMYCPGWRHEAKTKGRPRLDRIECFFEAAGLPASEAEAPFIPVTREEYGWGRGYLSRAGVDTARPVVGVQVYGTDKPRNWPVEKWANLLEGLRVLGASPVVIGTRAMPDCPCPQVRAVPQAHLVRVVAGLDLLVGPDSGLLHLASALKVPAVAVFGPTLGALICKHYPDAVPVQGPPITDDRRCHPPCHYQHTRGFHPDRCRARGCVVTDAVEPGEVMRAAVAALASPRVRPRGDRV